MNTCKIEQYFILTSNFVIITIDPYSIAWNFINIPEFTNNTNNSDVVVNFMWSPVFDVPNTVDIEYNITITGFNTTITANTATSNFTATLQFNVTYLISFYASICDNSLKSDLFTTNVTVHTLPPRALTPPHTGKISLCPSKSPH